MAQDRHWGRKFGQPHFLHGSLTAAILSCRIAHQKILARTAFFTKHSTFSNNFWTKLPYNSFYAKSQLSMEKEQKQKAPVPPAPEAEAPEQIGKTMPAPALFGGAPENKGGEGAGAKQVAGGQTAEGGETLVAAATTPVIDSNWAATNHYFFGGGRTVDLGPNTISLLLNHAEFQRRHARITGGLTTALSGSFSVDMTGSMFHVGRTMVNYSVQVNGDQCTVTYTLFVNDGFWDPDFIDEAAGRVTGLGRWQPDGMGPNLERLGGKPYHYNTTTRAFTFQNPGYR
jgi:hypothetical protein